MAREKEDNTHKNVVGEEEKRCVPWTREETTTLERGVEDSIVGQLHWID